MRGFSVNELDPCRGIMNLAARHRHRHAFELEREQAEAARDAADIMT